ncbi:MAG: transcription antitermination factor NusB [Acidobacteriota bacterium]
MRTTPVSARWQGRRQAREAALQMLYLADLGQREPADIAANHAALVGPDTLDLDEDARAHAGRLARGAWEQRSELDEYIGDAARNWRVERITTVDRSILRLAVYELLAAPSTPPKVVIDEAIELARAYSGDEAAKFVNGVLDGIFKRLKDEGMRRD